MDKLGCQNKQDETSRQGVVDFSMTFMFACSTGESLLLNN
jgi:hypothetical protein